MELVASGNVNILLGNPDPGALPYTAAAVESYNMSEVDPDRVYAMFSKLGYGYPGPFRGMSSFIAMRSALVALLTGFRHVARTYGDLRRAGLSPEVVSFASL